MDSKPPNHAYNCPHACVLIKFTCEVNYLRLGASSCQIIGFLLIKLTQASSALAMASMEAGLPQVIKNICVNAELIGNPPLGVENNVAHPTSQLNIAPAQSPDSCMY